MRAYNLVDKAIEPSSYFYSLRGVVEAAALFSSSLPRSPSSSRHHRPPHRPPSHHLPIPPTSSPNPTTPHPSPWTRNRLAVAAVHPIQNPSASFSFIRNGLVPSFLLSSPVVHARLFIGKVVNMMVVVVRVNINSLYLSHLPWYRYSTCTQPS